MNLFKEAADIKTADQLHLPTPEVEYHNIVAQPTEQQQEMVKALSERASLVHSGTVDPSQDNMLKITSDGRKLGLDQRIINQLLPDEPGTKVNQCVDNIMQIWRDGEADKLTQLVFCDISTPQARPAKKVAKALDNPTLHALEDAVPLDEPEPAFTVYEDIRQKLIAKGVPPFRLFEREWGECGDTRHYGVGRSGAGHRSGRCHFRYCKFRFYAGEQPPEGSGGCDEVRSPADW